MSTAAPARAQRLVVGIADLKFARAGETLITHALGSCLGIVLWDPVARVGGMLHVMLPESKIDPRKAEANPAMFVDTGVPKLFRDAYGLGALKQRLHVWVAGGASRVQDGEPDSFQIGKRNFLAVRKLLWQNGVMIRAHEVGGQAYRDMILDAGTGELVVRANGQPISFS